MDTVNYSLIPEIIKGIPFYKYEKKFLFIVNNKEYYTSRVVADIMSPIIRNYHLVDESINEFVFDIEEKEELFSEFLQLATLDEIEIDQKRVQCFSKYFLKLGNIIEYFNLNQDFFDDSDNIIKNYNNYIKQNSSLIPNEIYNKLIDICAENFYKIQNTEILKIFDLAFLEGMINSQSLRLKDEDSLLNSILDLYSEDQKYSILFEYVIFTNVKKVTLRRFFETFESSDVNHQLWESVISIFLHEGEEINIDKKRYVIQKVDEGEEIKIDNVNKKKVVFIGEASCGKTRIIYRELNAPCENILPTLAVDAITIKVDDNELNVFDTSGGK